MNKMIAMTAAAGLLLAGTAIAGTVTVQSTGHTYTTIQDAIDNATANDTISIGAGTYHESINMDKPGTAFNGLTIKGDSFSTTIIDGSLTNPNPVISFAPYGTTDVNNEVVTFENLTIQHGAVAEAFGGGLYSTQTSHITMNNCHILFNEACFGGGICMDSGMMTLVDCVVESNQLSNLAPNCLCMTPGTKHGAGIYKSGGTLSLKGTTVCSNQCDGHQLSTEDQISSPWTDNGGNTIRMSCNGADVNLDGVIDIEDVRMVQASAGLCYTDNNGDGDIDIDDLLNVIEDWGPNCSP
ncbi:MAG: hypothetical protein P8M22_08930 [Phycisphaerales bacterium]|nr:hypothetical protein [Phycisphaerales bacterium]